MAYQQFVTKDNFNVEPYVLTIRTDQVPDFDAFILKRQDEVLKKLFGIKLYNAFKTGLDAILPEQRWLDLRDGKEYTVYSYEYKWNGMADMLTPYIFQEWLSAKATSVVNIGGVAQANSENVVTVNHSHKISTASLDYKNKSEGEIYWFDNCLFGYLYFSDGVYDADVIPEYIQQYLLMYWQRVSVKNAFGI
jgi:hypothetical protein